MTFEQLQKIISDNNIPHDVKLLSDSGWECGFTNMDGVFYNKKENHIIFTTGHIECDSYLFNVDYECLHLEPGVFEEFIDLLKNRREYIFEDSERIEKTCERYLEKGE